ncbi:MAG: metallophosphoesterase family protein [Solirubrobacterales bacterium]
MNVAVISDIHANLPALNSVIEAIDESGVDEIWCLGDAVGYGASPSECLEILSDRCGVFLLGNHDLAALEQIDISTFSPGAARAALWTRENLTPEAVETLQSLAGPSSIQGEIGLYHASPRDPVWEYVIDTDHADENFDAQDERIAMIGHSHIALHFSRETGEAATASIVAQDGSSIAMQSGQWLVNPGSVGQPRDGDPRAAWLSLDTESLEATFHRVEYPIEKAAGAISDAGLPQQLADRLFQGR